MHTAIRRSPVLASALCACALIAGCGGSGAGLISSASAGPLEQDFVEVWQRARAGNGSCTATSEALEKVESDFVKISASLDASLRKRLQEGIERLHSQALEECSHAKATSTTTMTTKTHTTETFAPLTSTSVTTTQAAPSTSSPGGEEETPGGGGTPAPGGGENLNPGGAEAQGGQPNENGGGGAVNGGGR